MNTSVVLCTYNGERFLNQQLQSLLGQSRLPNELIISDDGSTDRTIEIIGAFSKAAPFAVQFKQNEQNLGPAANFESALALVTGDIVFLCDQDDVWEPPKLAEMSKFFEEGDDVGGVFTDASIIDENGVPLGATLWESWGISPFNWASLRKDPFKFLLTSRNVVTGATAAFSRKVIQASLPFPRPMAVAHDGWLALVAVACCELIADQRKLTLYRRHAGQVIGTKSLSVRHDTTHYQTHLNQLDSLATRCAQYSSRNRRERLELLNHQRRHLRSRLELPNSKVLRLPIVIGELTSGRYSKYSNGVRSAIKDLLRRSGEKKLPEQDSNL